MIRLLAGTRIALVVVAMAMAVPMITFAQTPESPTESSPGADTGAINNALPTPASATTDTGAGAQPDPPAGLGEPESTALEIEFQRLSNELRRELLDDRAGTIDWWLVFITVVLGFFAIVVVGGGYIGFSRFQEIEANAKTSVTTVTEIAEAAKRHLEEIERNRDRSAEIIQSMNAQIAADDPEEAKQTVKSVRENPAASLIDKVIAHALDLQKQDKRSDAIEQWRAIAHVAEGNDDDLAARSWFSVAYLLQQEPEAAIAAYTEAVRLNPAFAIAYSNRGAMKAALGQHEAAFEDYNQAIHLDSTLAEVYNNRGNSHFALGQYEAAIEDHTKAIHLDSTLAETYYNRGEAKAALGQHEAAIEDHTKAIHLDSTLAKAYTNRGVAKSELGLHESAIKDYTQAIRLDPEYAIAYSNRGVAKSELGLKDPARKDFETALELARKANNPDRVAQVEQLLRDLDANGGS